jgi:hypothetical protein
MVLALADWFTRVPVWSVSRTAQILNVTEKTVRNHIGQELEAIWRKGRPWITKRSVKVYLKKHYRPTAAGTVSRLILTRRGIGTISTSSLGDPAPGYCSSTAPVGADSGGEGFLPSLCRGWPSRKSAPAPC